MTNHTHLINSLPEALRPQARQQLDQLAAQRAESIERFARIDAARPSLAPSCATVTISTDDGDLTYEVSAR